MNPASFVLEENHLWIGFQHVAHRNALLLQVDVGAALRQPFGAPGPDAEQLRLAAVDDIALDPEADCVVMMGVARLDDHGYYTKNTPICAFKDRLQ